MGHVIVIHVFFNKVIHYIFAFNIIFLQYHITEILYNKTCKTDVWYMYIIGKLLYGGMCFNLTSQRIVLTGLILVYTGIVIILVRSNFNCCKYLD